MPARGSALAGLAVLVALLAIACSGAAGPLDAVGDRAGRPTSGPAAAPVAGDHGSDPDGDERPRALANANQLIVYTGSLSLEVAELRPAMEQAQQIVVGMGGHLAASTLEDRGEEGQFATVIYRIPADRWADALPALRALGTRVINEETDSEDVTDQVVDLEARLANLRVTETAFQGFMEQATNIDEVLKVQRELTNVREEIERLTAERDRLSERAALGTLSVSFEVPLVETARATEGWDLGREIDNALASLVRLGQGLTSLAIWLLLVVLPVMLPIALIVYIAYRLRRRWLATHPAVQPGMAASGASGATPPPGPWKPNE